MTAVHKHLHHSTFHLRPHHREEQAQERLEGCAAHPRMYAALYTVVMFCFVFSS